MGAFQWAEQPPGAASVSQQEFAQSLLYQYTLVTRDS